MPSPTYTYELPVVVPLKGPSRVALGKGRVAQLRGDQLLVRSFGDLASPLRFALQTPQGFGVDRAGGFLVIHHEQSSAILCRLEPTASQFECARGLFSHGPPLTRLFADSQSNDLFWSKPPRTGDPLEQFRFDATPALLENTATLKAPTAALEHTLIQQPDGSFVLASLGGLIRLVQGGPEQTFASGDRPFAALAPGPDASQVWAATSDSRVRLVKLSDPAETVIQARAASPEVSVFAMASAGTRVAVLVAGRTNARGETDWALEVFDAGGTVFRASLPRPPSVQASQDVGIAMSSDLVVVSVADHLAAWDLTGKLRFAD